MDKRIKGRFPANLLVSDNVLNDGKISKSMRSKRGGARNDGSGTYNKISQNIKMNYECGYNDSGSFSRYFDLDTWWEEKQKEME